MSNGDPKSGSPLSLLPNACTSYPLPHGGHPPPSALFTILSRASKLTQVSFHFSDFLGEVTLSDMLNCFLFHRLSKIRRVFHLLKAMGMPSMQNALQGILR